MCVEPIYVCVIVCSVSFEASSKKNETNQVENLFRILIHKKPNLDFYFDL